MNKLLASFLIDTVTPRGVSDSKVIISIEQYRKCGEAWYFNEFEIQCFCVLTGSKYCDSLKSIFRLLHNEKRAVHNITVYCEERYAERKNKEKSCYTDFQETDFRVLAQGG